MKKMLVLLVAVMLVICAMPASATRLDYGLNLTCTPDMYADTDLSQHETIYMILVGDSPADWPMVLEGINAKLDAFNTTLDVTFLSWSDHPTMYPLILAGGDKVDVCYVASGWCHLWEEAANENFYVLTEDFINTYMPMTAQYQDPVSWNEVKYKGDIIAVAQGNCPTGPALIGIREDLRAAYGLEAPTDYATFKAYLLGVAAHTEETGMIAMNADKSEGVYGQYTRGNKMNLMATANDWRYTYEDGVLPTADQLTYVYKQDAYRAYLDEAKELCDAGVWSRSAMNKTETTAQSFGNGTSAVMVWNYTVFQYMEMAEEIDGVECGCYDLWPDGPQITESYNNSCLAIYAGSHNPERAALVIDVCKWDFEVNMMICFGIKDYHYTDNGDGTYSPIADHTEGFVPSAIALSWIVRNGDMKEVFTDEREATMWASVESRATANVTNGFIFDTEPVAAYKAAVDAVKDEYRYTLGMGFFDDAETAYAEFMDALDDAGFEALDGEVKKQYTAWYETVAE